MQGDGKRDQVTSQDYGDKGDKSVDTDYVP